MSPSSSLLPRLSPAPAASLILLRQVGEMEVLVGARMRDARAFPGATVFPGGKLEAQDRVWPGAAHASTGSKYVAAKSAALRETFEETGLLITSHGEAPAMDVGLADLQARVEAGVTGFVEALQLHDAGTPLERLTPFAHWITPQDAPYRFDTLFFLAEASSTESLATLIGAEFESLNWVRPKDLLGSPAVVLMTPTRHCLRVLATSETAADAVEAARGRGLIDGDAVRAAQMRP